MSRRFGRKQVKNDLHIAFIDVSAGWLTDADIDITINEENQLEIL